MTGADYFFGKKLNEKLNVPIGLIDISYVLATIATFLDKTTVLHTKDTSAIFSFKRQRHKEFLKQNINWEENGYQGKRPAYNPQHFPTLCFNGMVNPIIPFSCKIIVWYQDESEALSQISEQYVTWFGDYISMMRKKFKNPELPIYYVQLAGFEFPQDTTSISWAKFRISQEECLKYKNIGMATAVDIGINNNIHPVNKQEIGRRLALITLNKTYGFSDIIYQGPHISSIETKSKKLILTFDHTYGGLVSKSKGNTVTGFSAELNNGEILQLTGKITSKNTIQISVSNLKSIRYAYANYPDCNLYNNANLPALPFTKSIY
ncbi:sialate O-acetylesterase [Gaetbulibacter aestuarii]|uniref:Sialate O-acetylesterase n=1 Tax=Gaetbulibacter aestuarii TaxID=1502358 RepID=A0ABW7MXY3_9FLAO